MTFRTMLFAVVLPTTCILSGCGEKPSPSIRLATTTSTENSGLLSYLLPHFQKQTGIDVHVMAMGTGKALRTAADGNCDVVLVHAPAAEEKFVADGWGVNRRPVMFNEFVILGPAADPAGVRGMKSAAEALEKIAQARSAFVSRGDNSGTHKKEKHLWKAAGIEPSGDWYRSIGKGMGEAITQSDNMRAYVLADRATYIAFRNKVKLAVLVQGDKALHNPYGVIAVNPKKHPHVKHGDAMKLIEFLTSDDGQKLIGDYQLDGEALFHPWPERSRERKGN